MRAFPHDAGFYPAMRPMLLSYLRRILALLAATMIGLAAAGASSEAAGQSIGEIRLPNSNAAIQGHLVPGKIAPGGTASLVLTAVVDPQYKIYALENPGTERPTKIEIHAPQGITVGQIQPERPPIKKASHYYEGTIRWTVPLEIAADAAPGARTIEGVFGYQICFETNCQFPAGAKFSGELEIDEQASAGGDEVPLSFERGQYPKPSAGSIAGPVPAAGDSTAIGALFNGLKPREFNSAAGQDSLLLILGAALIGGFILNFMPCVLPVIGLKVLSFVNQSDNRAQAFALNAWFSFGLIAVFLVLAALAAFAQLGWGQQFSSTWFNVAMAGLVFAMALSFLGVWEIPIPGFVGSGTATQLATREGAVGAFSKGVITTILSTPCSGPFLGPVFGFTLTQTRPTIFLIFFFVGLGMASPYLLIGAFPQLVRFLPKPGAWMDTFKQIMGFFLLGTVVFLFTFTDKNYLPATFCLLVGIWFACWWIGRTPLTAELGRKLLTWTQAAAAAALVGWFGFYLFVPHETEIKWRPFSVATLEAEIARGNTVFIDFTADWCATCKVNERFVINTSTVSELVNKNGVVALMADWTDGSEEIKKTLEQLRSTSIPLYAFFSADRPSEPIVLRDLVTRSQVIAALNEAGPSRNERVAAVGP